MLWPTNISNWCAKCSFIVLSSMCFDERKTRFWTDVFCFGFRPLARHFQPFKNRNIFMIPKDWYVSHVHCIALARYSLCSVDMINQIFFFVWIEFLWCTIASLSGQSRDCIAVFSAIGRIFPLFVIIPLFTFTCTSYTQTYQLS